MPGRAIDTARRAFLAKHVALSEVEWESVWSLPLVSLCVLMSVANPYVPPTEGLQLDLGPFDPGRHGLLRIQRARQFSDSLRGYRIEVDGQPRGGIRTGRATEIPLEPGSHQLILRMDWFSSPPVDFTIRAGEMFTFDCWSNIRGWRIIAAGVFAFYYLVRRSEYLSVEWTNTRPAVVVEPS